jgi:predicted Zn-dependent peptidase
MNLSNEDIFSFRLKNGIKIVHLQHARPVSYCGLLINAGSRDEEGFKPGVAHFLEHMMFKGTQKRKTHHILSRIDEVGGELNAYTAKENTFVYTSFLDTYIDRALDLMEDIIFHSVFPLKEIEKERAVIIDEFQSYKDDPAEEMGDQFDALMFAGHTLGTNILGSVDSVTNIQQADLKKFVANKYCTDRMVLCYIGPTPKEKFKAKAEKYFSGVKTNTSKKQREPFSDYSSFVLEIEKEMYSSHCLVGNVAYGLNNKKRLPFVVLNNILGGPGLNSRLNMNIREKYGYTYYLDASYTPFEECGQWAIYLSTDVKNLDKTISLVYKELKNLRDTKLSTLQLSKAKTQIMGQMALANENTSGMLHVIAKSFLLFDRLDALPDLYKKVEKITSSQLLDIANEMFDEKKLSRLVYRNKNK